MSGYVHIGRTSWWDGSVTTLCGITWGKQEGRDRRDRRWFPTATCPACKAATKGGK